MQSTIYHMRTEMRQILELNIEVLHVRFDKHFWLLKAFSAAATDSQFDPVSRTRDALSKT